MRIADNMTFDQVRSNVSRNRSEMAELQNQAATQKRVTKPSDDPVAASRVLTTRIDLSGTEQFIKNLNYAQSFLDFTDQSLEELTQHLVRVKELLIGQANDASSNPQSRRVVATEIDQIYNQIVKLGNRKLADRFIFGGFKTTRPPFDHKGYYKGDDGEIMIGVDKQSYLAMNLPGSKVFLGEGLSADGITHSSSRQATTIEEFLEETQKNTKPEETPNSLPQTVDVRSPASLPVQSSKDKAQARGVNLFNLVSKIVVALQTNDKVAVQNSLERVDDAISQVVLARSQVGSRSMVLNNSMESLQKAKVDSSMQISQMEDADAFKVISDINKTESSLKATLATSGKMVQNSLLDFLR